jgi:hypothetical protein
VNLPVRWLRPAIPATIAAGLLAPGAWFTRLSQLRRILTPRPHRLTPASSPDHLPTQLRLVFLPCAIARATLPSAPDRSLRFLVHGHAQQVEVAHDETLTFTSPPPHARGFQFPLTEAATLELVSKTLTRLRLARMLRGPAADPLALQFEGIVLYPFWVRYFDRGRNRIDFKMLDAITGRPTGPLMRHALLQALATEPPRES